MRRIGSAVVLATAARMFPSQQVVVAERQHASLESAGRDSSLAGRMKGGLDRLSGAGPPFANCSLAIVSSLCCKTKKMCLFYGETPSMQLLSCKKREFGNDLAQENTQGSKSLTV